MRKKVVLYSHGFGVRKDDRGLFTDIAESLPRADHIMFDYCDANEKENTLSVKSLSNQALELSKQIKNIDKSKSIDLIAHSQGCLVAALANPKNVRKIVFIAPPDNVDTDRMIKYFGSFKGSKIDLNGVSILQRRDGSTTFVPADYWSGLRSLNVLDLYKNLAQKNKVVFIGAKNDEVLGATNFKFIQDEVEIIQLDGNHDFNGDYRKGLISEVTKVLGQD